MPTTAPEPATQIALGIIERNGQFLLSQRAPQAHQGNLWEFPGGKIEPGETPQQALTRELAEELGIRLIYARPLLSFPWPYPNHPLHLHVLQVTQFTG
ncbi:MAG: (deoxy)nucleoside triphosphate pyrophosphohydrolase, partial [Cellvibrionales bacterium]|nr:(deoxy)nucleoside triphosphate pyrophosphohydrolase [Cellvibrionales bacterium]